MMGTAEQATSKPRSLDERADTAIESLRGVAAKLKELGDELVEQRRVSETLRHEVSGMAADQATLQCWEDALDDFRRGLIHRDELLTLTVGRA